MLIADAAASEAATAAGEGIEVAVFDGGRDVLFLVLFDGKSTIKKNQVIRIY